MLVDVHQHVGPPRMPYIHSLLSGSTCIPCFSVHTLELHICDLGMVRTGYTDTLEPARIAHEHVCSHAIYCDLSRFVRAPMLVVIHRASKSPALAAAKHEPSLWLHAAVLLRIPKI